MPSTYKVLSIIFPGFNTLDLNGPLDVFTKSGTTNYFEVQIAAEDEITTSVEGLHRALVLDDMLIARASKDFDVLHIAGGGSTDVQTQAKKPSSAFMRLIKAFADAPPPQGGRRILLSICTAAFFPGTLGVFDGRPCTTHWAAYEGLVATLDAAATAGNATPGQVLKARFVDSGKNAEGVQIISSGGISCGIDAALYVVKLLVGVTESVRVAQLLDYAWHQTSGVVFGDLDAPSTICMAGMASNGEKAKNGHGDKHHDDAQVQTFWKTL
ncbi:class I glutamine amidotransferase-like protein [Microdochium trichocladiopsis]|uniref:Class I glutamine amidotransferase-like protein n=1 Tax=Microdochium trichocladiopsis TaxID=1682393 RepID=A0A9P8XUM5_9PEZI|nr:class I glutamine amidotransferase-like protein [Microdochium trichocladiopsis]KAH7018429.1 class I glutamine amidotransferase-like protein [Microdochium trichocladiopsis]